MATEATIKTAIPTTSGFRNFAFYILIFAFSLLPSPFSLFTYPFSLLSWHLYNCRGFFTNHPFLCKTNPILSAVGGLQMNVTSISTKDYRKKDDFAVRKNKPNSNPIFLLPKSARLPLLSTRNPHPAQKHSSLFSPFFLKRQTRQNPIKSPLIAQRLIKSTLSQLKTGFFNIFLSLTTPTSDS